MVTRVILLSIFALVIADNAPEQIHLSLGCEPNSMTVTWTTQHQASASAILYGQNEPKIFISALQTPFVDGGEEQRVSYMHKVTLRDLLPNTTYVYKVGNNASTEAFIWSTVYSFRTLPSGSDWPLSFAMLGDMGVEGGVSIPYLESDAKSGVFQLLLHNGDFAYDFDTNNGRLGDAFMQLMQETAARVPYMTAVGNHESAYNFSHYKARFNMPGERNDDMFYSIDVGPVHFVAFVSDYYYFPQFGTQQIYRQYVWLEKDLHEANKPENRAKHPWIIAFSHRPMYCSNSDDPQHCTNPDNWIRTGIPFTDGISKYYLLGLEELFYREGVDIVFAAHEHSYERCYPVYKLKLCPSHGNDPYTDPTGPVHIVAGSAGNKESQDPFLPTPQSWSAFRSDDYGYMRITVHNATYMHLEQVSVKPFQGYSEDPTVIDEFVIRKSTNRPNFTCHEGLQRSGAPSLSIWDLLFVPKGRDI
ncbi:Iron/zinc purple acid phosphatase-like protein [Echinococcus granulosus]|uniref:Purple acid phosphatase n=1 Tax=Echinococcus granulosus TaxID=6210 RepID=W6UZE3_ECHGR|nr:Iron/zinc purple acid phosphatase-like protein [Echinococcus granulosus]EUB58999.1 Iron/zinc purple acid phosphatase-like protein [Echinococcus granulosus]